MTLDAILGAILFDELGDVDAAHAAIPIQCDDGLFYASSIRILPIDTGSVSFAASLRAQYDLSPDLIKKNRDGTKLHRTLGYKRRRDFGNVLSSYPSVTTETAHWYCTGDEERIAELLPMLRFIGKKRSQGFGEVTGGWEIEDADLDGITGPDGAPLRPVPVSRWTGRDDLVPTGNPLTGSPPTAPPASHRMYAGLAHEHLRVHCEELRALRLTKWPDE